jgi:hypothetical protein
MALREREDNHPRVGLALALAAAFIVVLVIVLLVSGSLPWWALLLLCGAALGLAACGAVIGIMGVIQFGLFTEGFGAREIEADRRKASISRAAGALGEATLFAAVTLAVVTAALHVLA